VCMRVMTWECSIRRKVDRLLGYTYVAVAKCTIDGASV